MHRTTPMTLKTDKLCGLTRVTATQKQISYTSICLNRQTAYQRAIRRVYKAVLKGQTV